MPAPAPGPVGRIIALHPDVQPSEYALEGERCTIGRSTTCDVVIARQIVSRLHARIEREGPRYLLVDAGSANGTFVNGQLIGQPHVLSDRDQIGFGAETPLLRFSDPDPTTVRAPRLRYDARTMRFSLGGQPLELTPAQFRLLSYVYQHAGEVCTREACAEAIWGRDYDPGLDAEALDRAVSNLRGQLRRLDPAAELLTTRRGLGYVLTP